MQDRIIITDIHLKEENKDIVIEFYKQLLARCNKGDIVKILGDGFDNRTGQTDNCLKVFFNILKEFSEKGVYIIAFPGNHDKSVYSSNTSYFDVFTLFTKFNLMDDLTIEDNIAYLPFYDNKTYIKKLEKLTNSNTKIDILFTHIGINEAMNCGVKINSDIVQGMFHNIEHVVTGHYHDYNKFGKIEYIGSSIQHNFGESEDKWVYKLKDGKIERFFKPNLPKYITEQIYLGDDNFKKDIYTILEKIKENNIDKYKMKVYGNTNEINNFKDNIRLFIPEDAKVKVDPIVVNDFESFTKEGDKKVEIERFTKDNCLKEFNAFEKLVDGNFEREKEILEQHLNK